LRGWKVYYHGLPGFVRARCLGFCTWVLEAVVYDTV